MKLIMKYWDFQQVIFGEIAFALSFEQSESALFNLKNNKRWTL